MGNVADQDELRRIHFPAVWRRYVLRAEYLKERREFLNALAEAREQWDGSFPAFAIGERQYLPPDDETTPRGTLRMAVYPRRLAVAINKLHAKRGGNHVASLSDTDRLVTEGADSWFSLVRRLSWAWWPPEYFPLGSGAAVMGHPAAFFVAGCLVYDPRSVPGSWIVRHTLGVNGYAADPDHPERHPDVIRWRTYALSVDHAIDARLNAGQSLSLSDLAGIRESAWRKAISESAAASPSYPHEWFWCVRLFPGMTSSDWRALEPEVLAALERV